MELSYFTCVFLIVRSSLWYQGQGYNVKDKVRYQGHSFQKIAIVDTIVFQKRIYCEQKSLMNWNICIYSTDLSKGVNKWEWVKSLPYNHGF